MDIQTEKEPNLLPRGCSQHWQSAEMEYRGSTSCQSAREPHAVLRQEEVVQKQNRNPFISPIYAFSGRLEYSMFLLTPDKLTSPKRPFLKKVPYLQWMGITKQVSLSFQGSRATTVAQTQGDHLRETHLHGSQRIIAKRDK